MNRKGFTIIELLGSMVILGLLMVLVVPNVVGLLNSNKETVYVEDAKKMVNIAKTKISMKTDITLPTSNNQCVFFGLGYLDNSEFDAPPNGGCYDVNRSFVIVKYYNHKYEYYVQLVEAYNGKYIGIVSPEKTDNLNKDKVKTDGSSTPSSFDYTNPNNVPLVADCMAYTTKITKNGPKTFASDSQGICAK